MKKSIVLFILLFSCIHIYGQGITFMTYNIRLDVPSDGENAWPMRRDVLVSQLKFYKPDIFGIQEGMPHQVAYIDKNLNKYNVIGEGRDGGVKGEYSAIYYNKNKFLTLKKGTFWLSKTPNEVSKGWDAAFPRICTYALFEHQKSKEQFWVFNTHFDHIGEQARIESVKLILNKIKQLNRNNFPVILMGDLNVDESSSVISTLNEKMNDSKFQSTEIPYGPNGTFNAFDYLTSDNRRIDYIFVSKNDKISVQKYGVLNNSNNKRFPSDHFPVMIALTIKNH